MTAGAQTRRLLLCIFAAAILSGCVTAREGPTLTSVAPLKSGQSRVVVFRPPGNGGLIDPAWAVQLDGAPLGNIKTGTFAYVDRPAGHHQLSFIDSYFPRPSLHDFNALPGRTYVFRIELNEKGRMILAGSMGAGLAGLVVTTAVGAASDDRGTYDFILVDEASAREVLAELHLASP
jgi:hypothetical protein